MFQLFTNSTLAGDSGSKPTPRAIKERISKIKELGKIGALDPSNAASTPVSTPKNKPRSKPAETPKTSTPRKRKRKDASPSADKVHSTPIKSEPGENLLADDDGSATKAPLDPLLENSSEDEETGIHGDEQAEFEVWSARKNPRMGMRKCGGHVIAPGREFFIWHLFCNKRVSSEVNPAHPGVPMDMRFSLHITSWLEGRIEKRTGEIRKGTREIREPQLYMDFYTKWTWISSDYQESVPSDLHSSRICLKVSGLVQDQHGNARVKRRACSRSP